MSELRSIFKYMFTEKKDIVYAIFFGFLAGVSAVGLFAASGYLISKAALTTPLYALIIVTSLVKLLGLIKAISRFGERYTSHRATFTILGQLRTSFFEKLEPLAPKIFHQYRSGDLLARVVGDIESLQNLFLRVFYPPIVLIMVFLSTILFTMFFSISIALILLFGLILTVFIIPALFAVRQSRIDLHVRTKRGRLSTEINEFFQGFRDLKVHQQLEEKKQIIEGLSNKYVQAQEQEGINKMYSFSINMFVSLIISWMVIAVGSYLVADGQLEGFLLTMLIMISLTVFEDATPMAVFPIYYQESKQAASRLAAVSPKESQHVNKHLSHTKINNQSFEMEMRNVTFAFPNETIPTLKDVTISFPKGSKTAIVGPSGSGKSTVLQLLLHFYETMEGTIKLQQVPIQQIDQESIWQATNVVLQENHYFYGTIRENLQMANDHLTDEKMKSILENVYLSHLSLDDHVLEKGSNLSGGEKQRLSVARAMLKGGRNWLLDEPTSSLDLVMEQSILGLLFDQAKEDTLIMISHRLSSLAQMDQIIVMDRGTIVEYGSQEALLNQKGYFYEMKQIEEEMI